MDKIGLYLHTPFCVSKCSYCDFYSYKADVNTIEDYTDKIISEIARWGGLINRPADTLYFGGGTPSLLGGENISHIVSAAKKHFLLNDAEITLECNPADNFEKLFFTVAEAGVNRISMGMQSADEIELAALSRRHRKSEVVSAVAAAKKAGINNISLDVMLGIPGQTKDSLKTTIQFALNMEPKHISAYMLTLEKGTPLYLKQNEYEIPSSDETAELYLLACDFLKKKGFERYEISNFSLPGFQSRHNNKYWNCNEYLGLGPSAHSFIDGKRFYYPRDTEKYMNNPEPIQDGGGGDIFEYVMLRLRLLEGLSLKLLDKLYDYKPDQRLLTVIEEYKFAGLINFDGDIISLTEKGALVSNIIIEKITSCL